MLRPSAHQELIELLLHFDLLSPWCWIAEKRIAHAAESLGGFAPLVHAPFPLWPEPRVPNTRRRHLLARDLRRAAREPELRSLSSDLWLSPDPPSSSLPGLVALAAARLQGPAKEAALREALRSAALVCGLNIARTDVILELAERTGFDMARFAPALAAPATERSVRVRYEDALDRGVFDAPSLVIGGEWLVSGIRDVREYRSILARYLGERQGLPGPRVVH